MLCIQNPNDEKKNQKECQKNDEPQKDRKGRRQGKEEYNISKHKHIHTIQTIGNDIDIRYLASFKS